jgi:hypothetical protein
MLAVPVSRSIAEGVSASVSDIRPPLQASTRQNRRTLVGVLSAALANRRRSAAVKYFRPAGTYRVRT